MRVFLASVFVLCLATFAHGQMLIPQDAWTLHYTDSEEFFHPGMAVLAFDGDVTSMWHSEWKYVDPVHPHEIQINLGSVYMLSGFRHLPRQDGFDYGQIEQYAFYVSMDGIAWGNPVAIGTFTVDQIKTDIVFSAPVEGQYVRLVALSSWEGPWTTLAELDVFNALPLAGLLTFHFLFTEPSLNADGTLLDDLALCTVQWSVDDNPMTDEVFIASTPMGGAMQSRTVSTDIGLPIDRVVNASAFCEDTSGNMAVPFHIDPLLLTADSAPEGFSTATVTITFE